MHRGVGLLAWGLGMKGCKQSPGVFLVTLCVHACRSHVHRPLITLCCGVCMAVGAMYTAGQLREHIVP